ncbi:hypothetical protein TrLO_g9812 [Triparma laevis f. longispina]|uniref:DUF6816 domain-containing protein n=1 Tax=Triparma laevis f. longispina TaxID=1714387 RepID=A0A9W7FRJ0_9STRA|nr:hypothetical protein TrLO_g9812 [Triparma laevis f. longispina]
MYDRSVAEIGNEEADLKYSCRFINAPSGVIADREFNIKSIVSTSMGLTSILSMSTTRLPNELTISIQPSQASGTIYTNKLLTTSRTSSSEFLYDEISRNVLETLTPSDPPKRTISLKEVETISSYEIVNDDVIVGKQRSLTFLVPNQDPESIEFKMWKATGGFQARPIDVRDYDLIYKRIK